MATVSSAGPCPLSLTASRASAIPRCQQVRLGCSGPMQAAIPLGRTAPGRSPPLCSTVPTLRLGQLPVRHEAAAAGRSGGEGPGEDGCGFPAQRDSEAGEGATATR